MMEIAVSGPDGAPLATIQPASMRVTVGRLHDANDIVLEPDPELLVSRVAHCALEADGARWFVVDGGSVNGTFLRRTGALRQVAGRTQLREGDVVCILGSTQDGEHRYFELAVGALDEDSQATRAAGTRPEPTEETCLEYDAAQARLTLVQHDERVEISIRAQAHRLLGYMDSRNRASGSAAALCTHDELMEAIWAGEPLHNRMELAKIVWELRKKLEPYGAEHLIENERGLGYRLRTCAS
jgi:DNA-binding response OmpR family regulator